MPRKNRSKNKTKQHKRGPGLISWGIIFIAVFIAAFAISIALRPAKVVEIHKAPERIRLQILNGCGTNGATEEMERAMVAAAPQETIFDVIDRGNAEMFVFDRTLVLDRKGDSQSGGYSRPAAAVKDFLGIDADNFLIQKFSENLLNIDVTIIVGADYPALIGNLKKGKKPVDS